MVEPPSLVLVCEHKVLSEAAVKVIEKRFGITPEMFPKILESDPQIKRINAKPGQLVEILSGDSKRPHYRYVIKG